MVASVSHMYDSGCSPHVLLSGVRAFLLPQVARKVRKERLAEVPLCETTPYSSDDTRFRLWSCPALRGIG